ncbi:MAG: class I adenylate cyclase [Deltaproteobacteria bacterium]|nr:class I adenylate cyclase [Deltaproteobacteria bacterium]
MTEDPRQNKLDPAFVKENILLNRKHFIGYHIARLRELIRYLPDEKLALFYNIPLLVHMNSPDLPGYVDHPYAPHGIYRFFDSGFWKLAKKRLRIQEKDVHTFLLKRSYIRGLYLMGSSGTLGQTEYSDFDYWVVIDRGSVSEEQRTLLQQKLERIEDWSKETYDHDLNFFVMDLEQIRQNDFSGIHEKGSSTAQKSLLKEEFYRTFILIAGQMPYWAILPAGLKDAEYRAWIETASLVNDVNFVPDDYVDLGNLTSIASEECLSAVLWQICRAWKDPVKSLIKGSLIAYYYFFQEQEGLLCDIVKKRFAERRLDSYILDPYALLFDKAVRFYDLIDNQDGLDLVKQCIYLRLTGYPMPLQLVENNPKRQILQRYLKAWSWGDDQLDRLESYSLWTENDKLQFEDRILNKLSFLYELIFRATGNPEPSLGMSFDDLTVLKNRTASYFKKRPSKIPRCSAYLRAKREACPLFIAYRKDSSGAYLWAVYDHMPSGSEDNQDALFIAPELLRVLGWIVLNGIYKAEPSSILFQPAKSPISPKQAERMLEELARFFLKEIPHLNYMRSDPVGLKVFVALGTDFFSSDNTFRSVDYLVQNTWGEMSFYSLDLRHIENHFLTCYEIAKRIWHYLRKAAPGEAQHRVYHSYGIENATTTRTIEEIVGSFRESRDADLRTHQAKEAGKPSKGHDGRGKPLLDLL